MADYDNNHSGYPEDDDADEFLDLEERGQQIAEESSRRRLVHSYDDDLDQDYRRVREQAQERRKASERARAAQARRRAKREAEIRRARRHLLILCALAAAAVAAIVVGVQLVHHGVGQRAVQPDSELAADAGTRSTESTAMSTQTPDAAVTEATGAGDTEALPSEEQVAADRAAKNYSEAVATFWPYYTFHTTAATQEIPSIPSDEEAYQEKYGSSASPVQSTQESSATADSAADAAGAENSDAGTGETVITNTGAEVPAADVVGGDYVSSYFGIVVDADTGDILAQKRMQDRIVPASMTKVMTLLVAVEQMGLTENSPELQDKVTLTTEDEEFAYINGSSAVCWMPGDEATVEDLMYGTILPSGADAAMALAEKTAGTADNFVKLMNQKAEELGISDTTHFTNCVGVYDEDHYSTVYDIAVIMKAALENDLCRKILSEHTWTTSPTSEHPEGITVSNWFLRRIEDKETGGTVLCAKTGFVNQSGYCGVSYQECDSGKHLIVCTADSWGNWRCINDHVALYNEYSE